VDGQRESDLADLKIGSVKGVLVSEVTVSNSTSIHIIVSGTEEL